MIICPICGDEARSVETVYGTRNSHCDLWSWGDAPLVDAETHEARQAAHAAFDTLWKEHGMPRTMAYAELAAEMGMRSKDCHMKLMNTQTANRVPAAVQAILQRVDLQVIE